MTTAAMIPVAQVDALLINRLEIYLRWLDSQEDSGPPESAVGLLRESYAALTNAQPAPSAALTAEKPVAGWVMLNERGEQVGYHASPTRPDDRPGWRAFVYAAPKEP